MQEIVATTSGGYRVEARTRDVLTVMDEPFEKDGTNTGPTPMEAMLASLAGCTAVTLKMYTARKGWPLEDVEVRIRLELATKDTPARITQEVTLIGELDDAQRERLQVISGRCPVHRIMEGPVEFEERLTEAAR